ncbi:2-amino-4-hydroxy-6-hydroxymethyldihydropteridine diphosphokinase [Algirhabdus cladophorae]|uniref:2-amino-4-hydroxy-6- hydroxymethyldihydropteridine diphosphokinase n=1 Tax=Algirhabdus cladophorae TaxID=3377108 RepID=UPI003B849F14
MERSQPLSGNIAQQTAFIALGSNLGVDDQDSVQTVVSAMAVLGNVLGETLVKSPIYRTPCFPAGRGPDFANAVVACQTNLSAADMLAGLHRIEADFGRTRAARWDARSLDLDLLALGAQVQPNRTEFEHWHDLSLEAQQARVPADLILPHPRLQDRAFVLVPFAQVAPEWHHPVLGVTVAQMLAALPVDEIAAVERISLENEGSS